MKILICGANGNVGKDLVYFLSKKFKIFAIYRNNKNHLLKNKNIKWIKSDLKNEIKLNIKPDYIINCIATHTFSQKRNLIDYYNSNLKSVSNLINFSKKKKVKRIINFSTVNVYGEVSKKILTEKNEFNNPDIVGVTKFFGEELLRNNTTKYINLRLPGILCIKNTKKYPIISRFLEDLKKNKKITIVNKGAKFNNVIDTFEISKMIEKIIFHNKKLKSDTVNVCASRPIKLYKVLSMLIKKTNSKSKINFLTKKNYSYSISFNKLKKILNFHPCSTEKIIERNLYSRYS